MELLQDYNRKRTGTKKKEEILHSSCLENQRVRIDSRYFFSNLNRLRAFGEAIQK